MPLMNNIYVMRGAAQTGPFSENDVRAQLASGEINDGMLVWCEGMPGWKPIGETPLAFGATSAPSGPPPIQQRTSGLATTSLILGCLGWLLPIVLGPAGVITGHLARAEIRRDPRLLGEGRATAGLILGYIWSSFIILAFISIVAISVLIALGNQVKTVYSTINSQTVTPATPNP